MVVTSAFLKITALSPEQLGNLHVKIDEQTGSLHIKMKAARYDEANRTYTVELEIPLCSESKDDYRDVWVTEKISAENITAVLGSAGFPF